MTEAEEVRNTKEGDAITSHKKPPMVRQGSAWGEFPYDTLNKQGMAEEVRNTKELRGAAEVVHPGLKCDRTS